MKSRQMIAVAVAVALGLPGVYLVCIAAGIDPIERLQRRTRTTREQVVKPLAAAPEVPDPPESVKDEPYSAENAQVQVMRNYESKLSPEAVADEMDRLMRAKGWEQDESWTRNVGATVRDGIILIYRQNGWQCNIGIYKSTETLSGSAVVVTVQPVTR